MHLLLPRIALTTIISSFLIVTQISANQDGIFASDAQVIRLADGFAFTEGPTANSRGDIYFTDSHRDHILFWSANGELSTFRQPSGGPVGMFVDHTGNLLVCAGSDKKLLSICPEGTTTVLAESYNGTPFNRPNDVFSHPEVGIYFTDPRGSRDMEEAVSRVYHLCTEREVLTAVIEDMIYPNGVVVTPDGSNLYVSDWTAGMVYVFDIEQGGTLTNRREFAPEQCDGMTYDELGNVYFAGEDGVAVYNPEGELIERIEMPEFTSNLCFGGQDRMTLFITARTSFYSLRMNVRGGY